MAAEENAPPSFQSDPLINPILFTRTPSGDFWGCSSIPLVLLQGGRSRWSCGCGCVVFLCSMVLAG